MAGTRQAIITHLREDTASGGLVEALGGNTSRIQPKGRIGPDSTFPMVGVMMGQSSGGPRDLPFNERTFTVFAYTRTESRNVRDFVTIDNLLDRAMKRLHGVIVSDLSTTVDEDFKPFEIQYEGFESRDLFDPVIRADCRWRRFRIYGVHSTDPRN